MGEEDDSLPLKFRHVRESIRKIKPEFYVVVDKLKSKYHCSSNQAVAAVIEVGNTMFGREWKFHDEDKSCVDLNTAPHVKNIRESGKAITALTLSCIVEEMLTSDDIVVTYHNDGSKKQGAGSYSFQGVTIDGKYRPFPTSNCTREL